MRGGTVAFVAACVPSNKVSQHHFTLHYFISSHRLKPWKDSPLFTATSLPRGLWTHANLRPPHRRSAYRPPNRPTGCSPANRRLGRDATAKVTFCSEPAPPSTHGCCRLVQRDLCWPTRRGGCCQRHPPTAAAGVASCKGHLTTSCLEHAGSHRRGAQAVAFWRGQR